MSDTNAQEPTMEEILASIRRIISEDDAPPAAEDDTPPAAVQAASEPTQSAPPPPEAPPPSTGGEEDDVLELTNPLDVSQHQEPDDDGLLGDLDFSSRSSTPAPAPAQSGSAPEDTLVSGTTANAAASSFDQLSRSIAMPADGRTLEDVVNQLLHPLLKDWLDRNLPSIVESKVQAEVERIARSRGY